MKVVFFGTPPLAAAFLQGLIDDPTFEIVGMITQPDEPVGRKKILTAPPVKELALQHNLPVFQPTKLKPEDFQSTIQQLGAEIGVVVAYGRILPDSLMAIFPHGCVNVHPSLLPKYRGPSPISAAIANQDTETAVTIMQLVTAMDAGPLLAQTKIALDSQETPETLTAKVITLGVPLLLSTLKAFVAGEITPQTQAESQVTFCKLLSREDGKLDWQQPAAKLEALIRAYNPWPGTVFNDLKIFSATITDSVLAPGELKVENNEVLLGTGTTALKLVEVQPAGGKRMSASDFARGYRAND
ncbi:MAG: methionyl-tRNA formyltransferase [Patescibacteria group bacterium]